MSLKEELLQTAKEMTAAGLNEGSAGNVSVRYKDGYLITPTGMLYDDCTPDDMVFMSLKTEAIKGFRKPSSEWRFHKDLYELRPEFGAIVHVHSPFATSLACLGKDIPPFHYMIAVAGGKDIRCTPYFTFGTQELSDAVRIAMTDRKACLLGNHGMLAAGETLPKAFAMAVEVENLCEIYWRTLQVGGANILSDTEMDEVLEKFKTYGQFANQASNQSH
ncbi:class II aldolase/adducin family protein [Sneathiella limimaris]|uniref:class II aldolase/adducin family protein n=1 Tax=Sneathiella limimaris TaxID=1964213 RepID=UPI00146E98C8|nr:class II aldolase/adducin family protein [Sneathiella limimaris]